MLFNNLTLRRFSDDLSAGFPSPAEGYEDTPLNLHDWLVRNPAATFLHRMVGDIPDEHICDGSILVIDRSEKPRPGRLILATSCGEFMVLRFRAELPIVVWGVVTAVVTRLR